MFCVADVNDIWLSLEDQPKWLLKLWKAHIFKKETVYMSILKFTTS